MTIQDAIKSGKPFRRKTFSLGGWFYFTDDGQLIYLDNGHPSHPDKEDILADDWEVKP